MLKALEDLDIHIAALKAYDDGDIDTALDLFARICDRSKILVNMALIYAARGDHEAALARLVAATELDSYLAVAYFQCGVSNFLLARYDQAYKDFEEASLYLRGKPEENYDRLGLDFRLFSTEILFNQGLSLLRLGRVEEGLADMEEAKRAEVPDGHGIVIDSAIRDRGEGHTVFRVPVGVLFRPTEKKLNCARAARHYAATHGK